MRCEQPTAETGVEECTESNLGGCISQEVCEQAGLYWCEDTCQNQTCPITRTTQSTPTVIPQEDAINPSITITLPASGTSIIGKSADIVFTGRDNIGIKKIEMQKLNETTWTEISSSIRKEINPESIQGTLIQGTYTLTNLTPGDKAYKLRVTDGAGNMAEAQVNIVVKWNARLTVTVKNAKGALLKFIKVRLTPANGQPTMEGETREDGTVVFSDIKIGPENPYTYAAEDAMNAAAGYLPASGIKEVSLEEDSLLVTLPFRPDTEPPSLSLGAEAFTSTGKTTIFIYVSDNQSDRITEITYEFSKNGQDWNAIRPIFTANPTITLDEVIPETAYYVRAKDAAGNYAIASKTVIVYP